MACIGRKTEIDQTLAKTLIEGCHDSGVTHLRPISGGEQSQAFQFTTSEGDMLLVRFRDSEEPFQKDQAAYKLFNSRGIPIPRVHQIEKVGAALWACISDFYEGTGLDRLDKNDYEQIRGELFEILFAIQSSDSTALVPFLKSTNSSSLKDSLSQIVSTETHDWEFLISKNYISAAQFEVLSSSLQQRLEALEDYTYCVHGDFGFNNVLAQNGKITAVLDWEALTVGDFVYDLAWLDFWPSKSHHRELFFQKYREREFELRNFDERCIAYTIAIGLDCLAVHGKYDDIDGCTWILNRLLNVSG